MNLLQKQFKVLVFKNIVWLALFVFSLNNSLFSQTLANDSIYVQSLFDSSKVFYTQGNYTKAIEHLQEILILKKKSVIDFEPQYFKLYNRFGIVYKKEGNFQKAIDYYNLALEHTAIHYNKSIINGNIANIYSMQGEYSKATTYLENSLVLLEKSNNKRKIEKIIFNYHNQGFAFYRSGYYELALSRYLKSIQLSKENKYKIKGSTFYNLGLIYKELDSLKKADFYFNKAIKAYENEFGEKHYMTAIAYLNSAVYYAETGQYNKGGDLFKKSYHILTSTLGFKHYYTALCLKNTGDLYYKKQNYNKALQYYQQSLTAKVHEFNDTCIYKNPAKDIYPDLYLLDVLNAKAKALEKLANKENQEKNLKAALQTLQLSVGFIEQLRTGYLYENSKLQLAAKEHDTYVSIIKIAYALYEQSQNKTYAETAFQYAELSKYTLLRELENEEKAKELAGIPNNLLNNEQDLKEQITYLGIQLKNEQELPEPNQLKINELQQKIFQCSNELETLNEKLETGYPLYFKQKNKSLVVNSSQIQKTIPFKDAILEYVLTDSTIYTFVLTKEHFVFNKQATDSTFNQSLDFYTKVLYSEFLTNYYHYRNAAYYLYKKLIEPHKILIKDKNLIIIPDNKLLLISFDALIDKPYKKTDNPDFKNESYLIRKHALSYAYSATLYHNSLTTKRKFFQKFLGIAPGYKNSKDSLEHLPLGLKNVKKLAYLNFGKSFTGDNATKNIFKRQACKHDVIQIYAHGFEDTLNPSSSKLYLSPSDTIDNGYLYAWEILNMNLDANLVVLAACYSGKGTYSKGEGVLSIARSFIHAGSKSIITSLWVASYKPVNSILNDFYKYSFKGMSKSESLQLAKLNYLEETGSFSAQPRFWSGIILYGNSTPLYNSWYLKRIIVLLILILAVIGIKRRKKLAKFF